MYAYFNKLLSETFAIYSILCIADQNTRIFPVSNSACLWSIRLLMHHRTELSKNIEQRDPGPRFNINIPPHQYRMLPLSYLHNMNSFNNKTTCLYWIGAQLVMTVQKISKITLFITTSNLFGNLQLYQTYILHSSGEIMVQRRFFRVFIDHMLTWHWDDGWRYNC